MKARAMATPTNLLLPQRPRQKLMAAALRYGFGFSPLHAAWRADFLLRSRAPQATAWMVAELGVSLRIACGLLQLARGELHSKPAFREEVLDAIERRRNRCPNPRAKDTT